MGTVDSQILMGGDYRPYFHIHDADFSRIVNSGKVRANFSFSRLEFRELIFFRRQPYPGTLISTTNPLLLMTCKHWPHILRTGVGKNDGVGAGLTSKRKRHIKKDAKVAKEVEAAFRKGDCRYCLLTPFQAKS